MVRVPDLGLHGSVRGKFAVERDQTLRRADVAPAPTVMFAAHSTHRNLLPQQGSERRSGPAPDTREHLAAISSDTAESKPWAINGDLRAAQGGIYIGMWRT